jgi:hypothetical protein
MPAEVQMTPVQRTCKDWVFGRNKADSAAGDGCDRRLAVMAVMLMCKRMYTERKNLSFAVAD